MYLPTLIVLIIVFAITALLVCKRIPKIKELSLSIAFSILFFVVFFIGNIVGAVNQRDRGFGVHSGLVESMAYIYNYHQIKGIYPDEKNFKQWNAKHYPNKLIRYRLEYTMDGKQGYIVGRWTGDADILFYSSLKGLFYYEGL